ncbi:class I SAM-dependent methyltransferase [Schauerella aestuarii]|uniref:class I SAM-dependent methyltransferase n=1 Tax=Schauerella aestuarii TaxID=2511204 RepID=UPI001367B4FC|nr:methyltransferase domain-containing protein [Achromobacter aestuarii]
MPSAFARICALTTLSLAFGATAFAASDVAPAAAQATFAPALGQKGKDVMWLPTPDVLATRLLTMAKLGPNDKLVDLGSGDGKIVIMAARDFGATARGVEFDPRMVAHSEAAAADAGVSQKTRFIQGDIFKHDFSDATVVALYLLPELNLKLRPQLMAMAPGTRIVSHYFDMGRWSPDQEAELQGRPGFLWIIPANAGGTWRIDENSASPSTSISTSASTSTSTTSTTRSQAKPAVLSLQQSFQLLKGTMTIDQRSQPVEQARVTGQAVAFSIIDENGKPRKFEGNIDGDRLRGTITDASGKTPFSATREGAAPAIDGSGPPTQDEQNQAALALGAQ